MDLLLLVENTYLGAAVACGEYLPWTCCCYWRILTLDLLLLVENTYLGPTVAKEGRMASVAGSKFSQMCIKARLHHVSHPLGCGH